MGAWPELDPVIPEQDALDDRIKLAAIVVFVALIAAIVMTARPGSAILNVSTGGIHEHPASTEVPTVRH